MAAMTFAAMILAACEDPLLEQVSFEPLTGEWTVCLNDGTGDHTEHLIFYSDSFSSTRRTYASTDGTCAGPEIGSSREIWRYVITGDATARIGTTGREVVAKQMTIEDSFETVFTIVYVDGDANPSLLYFGDLEVDPSRDGTTAEKRPDVLSETPVFTSR